MGPQGWRIELSRGHPLLCAGKTRTSPVAALNSTFGGPFSPPQVYCDTLQSRGRREGYAAGTAVCGGISWTWVDVVQHNFLVELVLSCRQNEYRCFFFLELGGPAWPCDFTRPRCCHGSTFLIIPPFVLGNDDVLFMP